MSVEAPKQIPTGMEALVAKIEQAVTYQQALARQRESELQGKVDQSRTELVEKAAQEEAKKRELAEQHRMELARAEAEGSEIIRALRVPERLETIRQTVWEGRGEIVTLKPYFDYPLQIDWDRTRDRIWNGKTPYFKQSPKPKYDLLSGMELVFRYQDVYWMETHDNGDGGTVSTYASPDDPGATPYVTTIERKLSVHVFNMPEEPEETRRKLLISNGIPFYGTGYSSIAIPVNAEDAESLLEEALVKDCVSNRIHGFSPSRLKTEGRKKVEALKIDKSQNKGRHK